MSCPAPPSAWSSFCFSSWPSRRPAAPRRPPGEGPERRRSASLVQPSQGIVVLTGAGISAESGLPTFRGAGGLWEGHRVEEVATPQAFARDPGLVHRFYNARRAKLRDPAIAPNPAHRALAELERRWPGEFLLVTQNVDDLHERAGSRRLIHLHGELARALCRPCARSAALAGRHGRGSVCPQLRRRRAAAAGHRLVRRDALPHGRGLRRVWSAAPSSSRSAPPAWSTRRPDSSRRRGRPGPRGRSSSTSSLRR